MTVDDLVNLANQYSKAVTGTIPYNGVPGSNSANSNGFLTGLLGYLGIEPPAPPPLTPGYDKPVTPSSLPPNPFRTTY